MEFSKIVVPMFEHNTHGYAYQMNKWKAIKFWDTGLQIEETLVSPRIIEGITFYPVGTFQCSNCLKCNMVMDDKNLTFYYKDVSPSKITCQECFYKLQTTYSMHPVVLRLNDYQLMNEDSDYIEIIDRRPTGKKLEEFMDIIKEKAKKCAEANGLTYIDGKNMTECRTEILQKWVINRLKNNMIRARRRNVFNVLYNACNIGLDAALCIAKQVSVA